MVKKRLTIGFALDWIDNPYQLTLLKGAEGFAEEKGVNFITFVGGNIDSPDTFVKMKNIIYRFITPRNIDGLIVSAASIMRHCSLARMEEFCRSFDPLPLVTLTQKILDYPWIKIDNSVGFRGLLRHLIHEHGYSRFGFISGTRENQDAEERYTVFRRVLAEEGVFFDEDYFAEGDFVFDGGYQGAEMILNNGKKPPQVIVVSNDDMARGAVKFIQTRNLLVPGDIAVTGFDNQTMGRYFSPPLTTVEQPVEKQGRIAAKVLIKMITGRPYETNVSIPSFPVFRKTCGCLEKRNYVPPSPEEDYSFSVNAFLEKKEIRVIIAEMGLEEYFVRMLVNELLAAVRSREPSIFLNILENFFYMPDLFEVLATPVRKFFDALRKELLKCPGQDTAYLEYLFSRVSLIQAERLARDIHYYGGIERQEVRYFQIHIEQLALNIGDRKYVEILRKLLSRNLIDSFYLSTFEKDTKGEVPEISRLIMGFEKKGILHLDREGRLFSTSLLIPENYLPREERFSWTVELLSFGDAYLGFVVFGSLSRTESLQVVSRRVFVTIALKAAVYILKTRKEEDRFREEQNNKNLALGRANELLSRLYAERQQAEEEVKKLNEELEVRVSTRTAQLEEANLQLQKTLAQLQMTQSRLIQSEKMAALGGLVAGIAHEINTPLGVGVTASSHLKRTADEIKVLFQDGKLKKSHLEEFLNTVQEGHGMILSNLQRAYDLINSFKEVAADQSREEIRTFSLAGYIDEILRSLQPELKRVKVTINRECPPGLRLHSYPGALSQILTNFVINSLRHGFAGREKGYIGIQAKKKNNKLILKYYDDGGGVPRDYLSKIFDPFFTTRRNQGGVGLGLNIVYNIVEQTLEGTIHCISRPGRGILFKITLPGRCLRE